MDVENSLMANELAFFRRAWPGFNHKLTKQPSSNQLFMPISTVVVENARSSAPISPTPTQMASPSQTEPDNCLPLASGSRSPLPVQAFLVGGPRAQQDLFSSLEDSFGINDVLSILEDVPTMVDPEFEAAASSSSDEPHPPVSVAKRRQRCVSSVPRWSVTSQQKQILESFFQQVELPSRPARIALAQTLHVTPQQVKVWFRNQRQRLRLKDGKEL